jgi:hypothetical protein
MGPTERVLQKVPFTPDLLSVVQDFTCGTAPWEQEVADWIRGGPGGVFEDMNRGCEVWLYFTDADGLIGFGSLGQTRWKWPDADSPREPINIIPMLGVAAQFHGQPEGPPSQRFAAQILQDYSGPQKLDRVIS